MYPWNKIEEVINKIEYERVLNELSLIEQQEGFVERRYALTEKTKAYLGLLGGLSVGVSVGIFTIICNFLLFVWLLHIELNPQATLTFAESPKESLAAADLVLAQYNYRETSENLDEEKSKETKYAIKRAAYYVEQAATRAGNRLEACAVAVVKGVRSVADKVIERAGWGTEEVGKDIKGVGAVLPGEGSTIGTGNAQKETGEVREDESPARSVYTIQVGAFEDYSNANALKTRFIKRGYNAYVTFTGPERRGRLLKLCKVWIGEFTYREEAEKVSAEIKKAEGLQAFVTLKRGQESIR